MSRKLAENVRGTYERYIVFHSDIAAAEAGAMTLWTFHTYVWELADATPYILVSAPTSEAGKSRVFDVARLLVHNPFVVVDATPATLFRTIDARHPTLMIDEADMLKEKPLKNVLNAGFQPGTPIGRVEASFDVFCPKIFSGIAGVAPPLTEATLSRCIQIPIRRKSPSEKVASFSARHAAPDAAILKAALQDWADMAKEVLDDPAAEPAPLKGLSDRQQDAWAPLLRIADIIGWGDEAREWAITLTEAIPKPTDPAVQILHDVSRVLASWMNEHEGVSRNRIPSSLLASRRNELETRDYDEELSPNQLGRRLAGFGINADSSPFRTGDRNSSPVRGYTFLRGGKFIHQWADAFTRYGLDGTLSG
jgi:hypothetical protein